MLTEQSSIKQFWLISQLINGISRVYLNILMVP